MFLVMVIYKYYKRNIATKKYIYFSICYVKTFLLRKDTLPLEAFHGRHNSGAQRTQLQVEQD